MNTDIAITDTQFDTHKYPLTLNHGNQISSDIQEIGGSGGTRYLDAMGCNREKNPIKKASVILAQIDSVDNALFENIYRRKLGVKLLSYYKVLLWFIPKFMGGDLLALKVQHMKDALKLSEKLFVGAANRKEGYIKEYLQIIDVIGPITKERVEAEESRTQIMQLFSQSICSVMERGSPKEGQYLFADELGIISESELRNDVMSFVLEEKDGQVQIRNFSIEDRQNFLIAMAAKYGARTKWQ